MINDWGKKFMHFTLMRFALDSAPAFSNTSKIQMFTVIAVVQTLSEQKKF